MSNVSYNEPQLVASRLCAKCGGVVVPGVSGPALVDEEGTWHRRCAVVGVPSYVYAAIIALRRKAEDTKWVTDEQNERYLEGGFHRLVRVDPHDPNSVEHFFTYFTEYASAPYRVGQYGERWGLAPPLEWIKKHWTEYLRGLAAGFREQTHDGEEVKL